MTARLALALLAGALLASSCGGGADGGDAADSERLEGNLFANASFEDGREPWFSLSTEAWGPPFALSGEQALAGDQSALLQLRSADGGPARVYGVVGEIAPDEFPELLSASYFVDSWQQGTPFQYLQIVVIAWQSANLPPELAAAGISNHQIRYILAGVDEQPTFISNARYVMLSDGPPATGEWISFERDVRRDFEELWGAAPGDYEYLRVFFEVRWDDRSPSDGPSSADVYYDDLYLGPPIR